MIEIIEWINVLRLHIQPSLQSNFRTFPSLLKKSHAHIQSFPKPIPLPPALGKHVVSCISTSLFFLLPVTTEEYSIVFCLHIYQLMNIWVASIFWLLWIMLLWTFMYKSLCGHFYFSFLSGRYLGVEFLDHMLKQCLTFWGTAKLFPKQLHHFTFPLAVYEGSNFSTSSNTCYYLTFLLRPF